jgi:aspartate/methionine/tyrosine aminotransferase
MFSRRTDFEGAPHELHLLRTRMVREGIELLDLTESNPTRCAYLYPEAEIVAALADRASLGYEPDPRGGAAARAHLARWLTARGAAGSPPVDPGRIVLAASTSEAYAWLFKILCEPGDEVLVPSPSYPLLDYLAQLEGVRLVRYPLAFDDRWRLQAGELERCVGPRTRAVVVVQPSNPAGSFLDPGETAGLRAVCRASGLALVSDEVFLPYRFDETAGPFVSLAEEGPVLTFALGGLSKAVGLPQMKLAWIVAAGPEPEREAALDRLEWIGDTFLSVGTPVQAGLDRLLRSGEAVQGQILSRVRANRRFLQALRSSDAPWDDLPGEGGWTAVLRVPRVQSDHDWAVELLRDARVVVHPGDFFEFGREGHLVVSLLPPPATFQEGVRRIDAAIRDRLQEPPGGPASGSVSPD